MEKDTCGHERGGGSNKGGHPLLVKNRSTELFGGEKILQGESYSIAKKF